VQVQLIVRLDRHEANVVAVFNPRSFQSGRQMDFGNLLRNHMYRRRNDHSSDNNRFDDAGTKQERQPSQNRPPGTDIRDATE
jgi:hypothetical protein